MKIEPKNLNLVVPIDTDEHGIVYVHSMPIKRETFKRYFLILSKTLNEIYMQGLQAITGPRIAALLLQKFSEEAGIWPDVQTGLINEIRRLSNILVMTPDGWKNVPFADCVTQGYLTEDEVEEAEGFIVFFICISHVHRRKELSEFLQPMQALWDVSTTLLNVTGYRDSLPTSTETETFVPTVKASSVPS